MSKTNALVIPESSGSRKLAIGMLVLGLLPVITFITMYDKERLANGSLFGYIVLAVLFFVLIILPLFIALFRKSVTLENDHLTLKGRLGKESIDLKRMEWWRKVGSSEKGPFLPGDMLQIKHKGKKTMLSSYAYDGFDQLLLRFENSYGEKRK